MTADSTVHPEAGSSANVFLEPAGCHQSCEALAGIMCDAAGTASRGLGEHNHCCNNACLYRRASTQKMAVPTCSPAEPLHVLYLMNCKQGGCTHALHSRACLLHIAHPNSSAVLLCRQMLETSTAVQCPSVAYQLAGTKKVQQDLAAVGTLEHFLPGQADRDLVDACCAGLLCHHRACLQYDGAAVAGRQRCQALPATGTCPGVGRNERVCLFTICKPPATYSSC